MRFSKPANVMVPLMSPMLMPVRLQVLDWLRAVSVSMANWPKDAFSCLYV